MSKKNIVVFSIILIIVFALGAQLGSAKPVSIKIGNNEFQFLPLILSSQAETSEYTNQLVHEFIVAPGENINSGDVVTFFEGYVHTGFSPGDHLFKGQPEIFSEVCSDLPVVTGLSTTQFVVACSANDSWGSGISFVGNVDGMGITYGDIYPFKESTLANPISLITLSPSKFLILYLDPLGTNIIIGETSGSSISFGSESNLLSVNDAWISTKALTDSKVVFAYTDTSNLDYGTAVIGDISDKTITLGSSQTFNTYVSYDPKLGRLNESQFLLTYYDAHDNLYYARICDVLGTSITFNSENTVGASSTFSDYDIAVMDSTKFLFLYSDIGSDYKVLAKVGNISSSTITFGTEYELNIFGKEYFYILNSIYLFSSYVLVCGKGEIEIVDVSGDIVTNGEEVEFGFDQFSSSYLSESKVVISYGVWDIGSVIVETLRGDIVGIARESRAAEQSIPIVINGISGTNSGLIVGENYFANSAGTIMTVPTQWKIGMAISSSELLMDIEE